MYLLTASVTLCLWPYSLQQDSGYNGEKADILSTGVMLYATLAGRYPCDSSIPQEHRLIMMREPLRGLPADLSAECRDLLESLLHPDPEARITVAAINQHPWFLQDLPPDFATMADDWINAASPCRRTPQEVEAVIQQALQRLPAAAARVAQPAVPAMAAQPAVPAGAL